MDRTGRDNAELDGVLGCEQWEAILADKMDSAAPGEAADPALSPEPGTSPGGLSPEKQAAFVDHSLHCPGCGQLMEQARQGQLWLQMLHETKPAPPVDLLSKILARTRGAGSETDFPLGTAALAAVSSPAPAVRWPLLHQAGAGLLTPRRAHNARLLMTAAMAFFSVALTLSVAGVKITSVHAAELRPQIMQANMTRSFYGTKKQVVSFYENLRLVYEVESKMHELRRDVEPASTPAPQPKQSPAAGASKPKGSAANGSGRSTVRAPEPVLRGWPESVHYTLPADRRRASAQGAPQAGKRPGQSLLPGASMMERNRI